MKDYYNFIIIISVSIIISTSITLFIYYKNKDANYIRTNSSALKSSSINKRKNSKIYNNTNNNNNNNTNNNNNNTNNNTIENFASKDDITTEEQIINNNNKINDLILQLNSASIVISPNVDKINNNFVSSISSNIGSIVSNMNQKYEPNNNTNNINITNLENNLIDLENMIANIKLNKFNNIDYTRIKSLNNGMDMNIVKSPNAYFTDLKTGSNTAAYLLKMNNGCLSVGANDYDVKQCDDKNPKQYFYLKNILNETDYNNNIDKAVPFDNVDKTNIMYPFAMLKSVNNENCVTNNHGSITVQPCYSLVAQRWMPL